MSFISIGIYVFLSIKILKGQDLIRWCLYFLVERDNSLPPVLEILRDFQNMQREHNESDIVVGVIDSGIWPVSKSFIDKGNDPPPKKVETSL